MASTRWGFGVGCWWLRVVAGGLLLMAIAVAAVGVEREGARAGGPFMVASTSDQIDDVPGDGVCKSPDTVVNMFFVPGRCTLRAAIEEANALAGDAVITLPGGTYLLTLGELEIAGSDAVTIDGAGAVSTIIDGGGSSRVINVGLGPTVDLSGVTITNGNVGSGVGGGVSNNGHLVIASSVIEGNTAPGGAGIFNAGVSTLMLTNTVISDNSGGALPGGGISNAGVLQVVGSTVSGNSTMQNGGGIGQITGGASLTLTNSSVSGNTAVGSGGGIYVSAGTTSLISSTVSGNMSASAGGGGGVTVAGIGTTILLADSTVSGNMATAGPGGGLLVTGSSSVSATLTDSTVSGNAAMGGQGGGGIFVVVGSVFVIDTTLESNTATSLGGGISIRPTAGPVTLTRSTVSQNSAPTGGGIANTATVSVSNSTISDNSAVTDGGGIYNTGTVALTNGTVAGNTAGSGGGAFNAAGTMTLRNTIVGPNVPSDCGGGATSQGNNLDSDGSCGLAAAGDLPGMDPLLGPLADNGGPTQTRALLAGSPAIDAGDNVAAPAMDQRGEGRQGQSDIGAFELQPVVGVDGDGDGFDSVATGGTDCDDGAASVFPGAPEVAGDGVDQDCDGVDLMEEEEKAEPPKEEEQPPEEEKEKPTEETPTGGDLVLMGEGEFVFWELIPVLAADVFGTVKIAWLWNPLARDWTSFVPVLGVVNFAVAPRDLLWVVSEGPQTIVVG